MLKFDKISKVYRTEDIETTALNEISLEIKEGEFVAIMGPSGCGKSSILNIFGLLSNPSSGKYHFLDQEVSSFSEKQLANIRKANIGYIFQEFNLIDELTVYENVELALLYQNISKSQRRDLVKKILEDVGISHRMNHYPKQLSGGQQQRVAIARALVAKPKLIGGRTNG
jgi:putative ABC transport system ATP-binding protein